MEGELNEPAETKRAPGRPKKNKAEPPSRLRGVLTAPDNPDSRIEMTTVHPSTLGKVLTLIKDYGCAEVDFLFTEQQLTLVAIDHKQKVDIIAELPASRLSAYFCGAATHVKISQKNLHVICSAINKNHAAVTIVLRGDYRSHVYFLLSETSHESITQLKIGVGEVAAIPPLHDESTYPLQFSLSTVNFKPMIASFRGSKHLSLAKDADYVTLQPERDREKMNVDATVLFPLNSSLQLRCTLAPSAPFSVSIDTSHIVKFASKAFGEYVRISADHTRKLVFSTESAEKDGRISVKICVELAVFTPDIQPY